MIELMLAIFVLAVIMTAVAAALATAMRAAAATRTASSPRTSPPSELDQIREDSSQDFDTLTACWARRQ